MHRLFLTLSVLGALLVHVGGAGGNESYREWLTFNEVTLDGHKRVLSRHDIRPAAASLSPDHKHLAYVPYVSEGSRELWIADVKSPRERLLVEAPGWITSVAWAPNGRTIALWVFRPPRELLRLGGIWLVEVDGSNLRRAADLEYGFGLGPAHDTQPGSLEWAPSSRQLAYARYNAVCCWFIGVLDIATGLSRDWDLAGGMWPHWSPNGREIAYSGVWVVSVSSGAARLVADGSGPSWSPDGRQIAYRRGTQLRVVRSTGGRARLLVRRASEYGWSPNGRWIAFTRAPSSGECRESIHVVPAKGGRTRRLATETRRIQTLAWNRTRVLYQATKCIG